MVDAKLANHLRGAASAAYSGIAAQAEASGSDPFGPGLAVHLHGLGMIFTPPAVPFATLQYAITYGI